MTLDELSRSRLVVGSGEPGWDSEWRALLVRNLSILTDQLWQAGIEDIFIDGSFVEDRLHPHDIDGYFLCKLFDLATGDLERRLNALDPKKCWTWDGSKRRLDASSTKAQLPMWHLYRVELYPHYFHSQSSGIRDEHGRELPFPAAFRRQRDTGLAKGIIHLVREGERT